MIKINNVDVKTPSKYSVVIADHDGENNTNAKGENIRDRVSTKRTIDLEWNTLTQIQCSAILNAIVDVYFTVTFPDPQLGMTTKTCYVGSRTLPMYSDINNVPMWDGLKLTFTER